MSSARCSPGSDQGVDPAPCRNSRSTPFRPSRRRHGRCTLDSCRPFASPNSAALGRYCCKTISRLPTRNIDSRTSQSAQYRIRNAGFPDSIIARWQRSKEFCNKIGQLPPPSNRSICSPLVPKDPYSSALTNRFAGAWLRSMTRQLQVWSCPTINADRGDWCDFRCGSFSTDKSGVASGPFPLDPESRRSAFAVLLSTRVVSLCFRSWCGRMPGRITNFGTGH